MLRSQASRVGATTVVVLVLLAVGWPTVEVDSQDSTGGSITIYKAECSSEYTGNASADECDDNPVAGIPFRVGRPYSEAFTWDVPTNDDGLVTFDITGLLLDGILRVIEILPTGTERFVAYCVDDTGTPLDISYPDDVGNPALGVADVAVGDAGDVACDWYNVPKSNSSNEQPATAIAVPPSACTDAPALTPTLDAGLNLPGYVAIFLDGAIFVTWTESNGALAGTLYMTSPDDEIQGGFESQIVGFTGIRSGDQVSLSIPQGFGFLVTVSGTLAGETLTLYLADDSGYPVATVFQRGEISEYDQAVRTIQQQGEQSTECIQAVAVTATAIAERQDAVDTANAELDSALQQLATDVDTLETSTSFDDVFEAYANDWARMEAHDQEMRTAAAVAPLDCYQLSGVEYELSQISYDMTEIDYNGSSLDFRVDDINTKVERVETGIITVQDAFQRLGDAIAADTSNVSRPWFSEDDIDTAVSEARQEVDDTATAIEEAQEVATEYEEEASQLLLDAQGFVDGLTCSN